MKYFLLAVIILLNSCSSSTKFSDHVYEKDNLNEITDEINKGKYLQVIEKLHGSDVKNISEEDKINYVNLCKSKIISDFIIYIKEKDFDNSIRLLESYVNSGFGNEIENIELKDLYESRINKEIEKGNNVKALYLIRKYIYKYDPGQKVLNEFAETAYTEGSLSILNELIKKYETINIAVPDKYTDYINNFPDPFKMMKSVVTIWVNKGMKLEHGYGLPDRVIGSGFFIDKRGYLITNYHVIESEVDPEYEGYSRLYVRLSNAIDEKIPAKVIGYDRILDIALLKTEITPDQVFSFEDKKDFKPGEKIYAIGSPGGLENTITSGIISAKGRRFLQIGDAMQMDVPINHGNSGGPLVNDKSELLGVVFAGIEQFEGINFAIPSHWVSTIVPYLYDEGEFKHKWIGASVYESPNGLEVLYSLPGEAAYNIGIDEGDIITHINGKKVNTIAAAQKALIEAELNSIIDVKWISGEKEHKSLALCRQRPYLPMEIAIERDNKEDLFIPMFGMKVRNAGRLLWGQTMSIEKIYKGSIADEIGLSINDPFVIKKWIFDKKNTYAGINIKIKKRKAGFLESEIQLYTSLKSDNFI